VQWLRTLELNPYGQVIAVALPKPEKPAAPQG
jgi:hypothetical protein